MRSVQQRKAREANEYGAAAVEYGRHSRIGREHECRHVLREDERRARGPKRRKKGRALSRDRLAGCLALVLSASADGLADLYRKNAIRILFLGRRGGEG